MMILDDYDTVRSMQQIEGPLLKDDLPDVTKSSGSAFSEGTLPLLQWDNLVTRLACM